jgi:PAS domain S-box-containing protein
MMGALIVAPLVLIWSQKPRLRWSRVAEAALVVLVTFGVCRFVFHSTSSEAPFSRTYALFPLLIWAALRFGQLGAVSLLALVAAFAVHGTAVGLGPFSHGTSRDNLLSLQLFVATGTVTFLLLCAAMEERRRSQRALQQSEQRLLLALDAAQMGTWEWNLATNRVTWSERVERIHGLLPGTFDGTLAAFERDLHPDDLARVRATISNALEKGSDYALDYRILAQGKERWIESRARVVLDASGRPSKMVGLNRDVTEQKSGERALDDARREAVDAANAREELLAMAGHDLRNPLTAILTNASVIQRSLEAQNPALMQRLPRQIEMILKASGKMARLISDLVDYARIEAGRLPLKRKPEDARHIVEEALETLMPQAEAKHVRIDCGPADVGIIDCDRGRIGQVLSNLVGNAIKYVPDGGEVRVRVERQGRDVLFSVADNGPGIAQEQLPFIFKRFWRGQSGETGSGLGLYIARGIVEAHGGRIWVESQQGAGSTFHFTLPVGVSARTELPAVV